MSPRTLSLSTRARPRIGPRFAALLAAATLLLATMALAAPVFAATIVVNEDADEVNTDGDCSLREAVIAAENNVIVDACPAGNDVADTITIPTGTYQLASVDIELDDTVSLVGADRATTTVVGPPEGDRVFSLGFGDVSIANLTITGGQEDDENGGGITVDSDATLTLTNSTVTGNEVLNGGGGGGIYVSFGGSATITNSLISDNTSENDGGGIFSNGGVSLINSAVNGNHADFTGGGILSTGNLSLLNTTVDDNTSAFGAGIFLSDNEDLATITIDRSTISNNVATATKGGGEGGGIFATLDFTVVNSTVSGNSATSRGGGIYLVADLRVDFSTITDNSSPEGAGIWVIGNLELFATVVANNDVAGGDCFNGDANLTSLGSNIDSDDTCELNQPTDQPDADPMLGSLAANGGPTLTHALLAGSPAIDAVTTTVDDACVATDQRGTVRPQDGDNNGSLVCDIGAFEVLGAVAATPTLAPIPTPAPSTSGSASPSPTAGTLPDTAGDDPGPSEAPWLGFAVLALIAAAALTLEGLRRRYANPVVKP